LVLEIRKRFFLKKEAKTFDIWGLGCGGWRDSSLLGCWVDGLRFAYPSYRDAFSLISKSFLVLFLQKRTAFLLLAC
jgi:hypothetical protein